MADPQIPNLPELEILLIESCNFRRGRRPLPDRGKAALAGFEELAFPVPDDCSDTFARRAASATVISPARIDSTIRTFSSAGNTGGLAMTIRLLDGQTRKKRALPGILTRDIINQLHAAMCTRRRPAQLGGQRPHGFHRVNGPSYRTASSGRLPDRRRRTRHR
jgi:hypothetical protein